MKIIGNAQIGFMMVFGILLVQYTKGFGQQLDHVQGELLVVMNEGFSADQLAEGFQVFENGRTGLTARKINAGPLNVVKARFDHNRVHEFRLLQEVKKFPGVKTVQFNHLIEYRNIPNDPRFSYQWQYINTGESGGVAGADIDMELAWDLTTGGLTVNGDTIVVCVIDGGMDPNHMDFENNLWVNYGEIPDNGIDDDMNGYVDDRDGWNVSSDNSNDNVFSGGSHGTPVAGIIGAKGNNGVGVSGVNWDVKLMIVKGGGSESEALEAYHYPYIMRKKYNESNGAEGAFVVATNASWGTDKLHWEDAPLWCSFYDSLGSVGILNCGATSNNNYNIDEVGDMPTSCPSDFLLAVTNMDRTDKKVNYAGYGLETIDLGAFGEDTYTVKLGNTYGGFGGTSGATPHVTGAIALAYSLDCPSLSGLALSNPPQAALLVREMILAGVDQNESLEGKTVTGGRLNINNSLVYLNGICSTCPFPLDVNTETTGANLAEISWEYDMEDSYFDLVFHKFGETDWDTLFSVQSPVILDDLELCTKYEFKIRTVCTEDEGKFSFIHTFRTDGCCILPESHNFSISELGVIITVQDILATDTYILRYKKFGDLEWDSDTITGIEFILPALDSCSYYEYQFKSLCGEQETDFSPIYQVGYPCTGCGNQQYCLIPISNSFEYIKSVRLGNFMHESGAEPNGYTKYSEGLSAKLKAGVAYDFSLTPGFFGNTYDEYIQVYMDFNLNGEFENEEKALDLFLPNGQEMAKGSLVIPMEIEKGYSAMRVILAFKSISGPCNQQLQYGEVEDYCIYLENEVSDCLIGNIQLDTISVGKNTAHFAWNVPEGSLEYLYRYKKVDETIWLEGYTADAEIILGGLDSCSNYVFQLKKICTDGEGEFSDPFEFDTDCISYRKEIITGDDQIRVYPNPFKNELTIRIPDNRNHAAVLTLFSGIGKRIGTIPCETDEKGRITVRTNQISDSMSGLILIKVESNGKSYLLKAVCSD